MNMRLHNSTWASQGSANGYASYSCCSRRNAVVDFAAYSMLSR